jgi:hypothetical protein
VTGFEVVYLIVQRASLPVRLGAYELSGSIPIGSASGTFDAIISGVTECWPFIHRDSDFPGVEIRELRHTESRFCVIGEWPLVSKLGPTEAQLSVLERQYFQTPLGTDA